MSPSFQTLHAVHAFHFEGQTLVLDCQGPRVAITPLTDRIIRVRLAPDGRFAPCRPWAVATPDEEFPGASSELEQRPEALILRTAALAVEIRRDPCRIAFLDGRGWRFCADSDGLAWRGEQIACAKQIEPDEHFYGFGERTGQLDSRGRRLINWTTDQYRYCPGSDPLYIAIPSFIALRPGLAYGIYFNNTWRSSFDIGAGRSDTWTMEAAGGELDYYLVYGPTPTAVSEGFAHILGTTPLPPRWALGYHQSRWSYSSEAQLRELAAEFRSRDIPCDGLHLDIDYMDGYRDFTWDAERFPDPQALIAELKQQGFETVAIVDAGVKVDPEYFAYQEGSERDMFIRGADGEPFHGYVWPDDSVFPDFIRADVRTWWGDLQQRLIDVGIGGIWNDMNEPTVFEKPFSQGGGIPGTIDLKALHGPLEARAPHAELHNLYGSSMARASYEGLRRSLGQRPFVLTRSGFAGVQRWSACWMGDNMARWEHLEMAMPQLLNMGLSGVPFVGTDIGGFFDNATGELFARWMQFGALMPFCRGHSHAETERHEPWVFGPRVEAICREYLKLRYRLLPYLYSLFWESWRRGSPVLRPLLYEFPDDAATYQLHDQVMLGSALLAAPIYQPGREHRAVYLPAGTWYDWWSAERIEGPAHLLVHAPLERMPLYARAGAIIPSGPELRFTAERPLDSLTLDLYPGAGEHTLYEDDGRSFDYERGMFCTTTFRLRIEGDALLLEIGARSGRYTPPIRRLLLRVHGLSQRAAAGMPGAGYDHERRLVTLDIADDGQPRSLAFALAGA